MGSTAKSKVSVADVDEMVIPNVMTEAERAMEIVAHCEAGYTYEAAVKIVDGEDN